VFEVAREKAVEQAKETNHITMDTWHMARHNESDDDLMIIMMIDD